MKKFCSSLREHATNVIHFEKNRTLPLAKKELKLHQDMNSMLYLWKMIPKTYAKDKNYRKVRDH